MGLTDLTPFQQQTQQRRIVKAVVADLVASSRTLEAPTGLVTLVDIRFLRELADVAQINDEAIFAVVDETHLNRMAQAAGVTETVKPPAMVAGSPLAVDPAEFKAACKQHGWTVRVTAMEFGVSEQTIYTWFAGRGAPKGEYRRKAHDLIAEMRAALAAEKGPETR